jgi:hypothetical protein
MYAILPYEVIFGSGEGYLNGVGLGIPIDEDNLIIYQLWWFSDDIFGEAAEIQWSVEAIY